ncbi:MAG: hypothetical protein LBR74_02770 [Eubacterium sp.]|nr:hypothetical protein [Eubacterium sp.]
MKKICYAFISAAIIACLFTACKSEADKAYEAFVNGSAVELINATETYKEKSSQATDASDGLAMLTATDEYIVILKSAINEMTAIKIEDLSPELKSTFEQRLNDLQASLNKIEEARSALAQQIDVSNVAG